MCPHERGCARTRNGENLSEVTPHTLRRTFGSDLLNRGLRLEVVSKLLGHASTVVTERASRNCLTTRCAENCFAFSNARPRRDSGTRCSIH
jgi:integrase